MRELLISIAPLEQIANTHDNSESEALRQMVEKKDEEIQALKIQNTELSADHKILYHKNQEMV